MAPLSPRDRRHHEVDLDAVADGAKESRWRRWSRPDRCGTIRLGEGNQGYGWVVLAGVMLTLGGTLTRSMESARVGGSHF
jgi:hypothetical protein